MRFINCLLFTLLLAIPATSQNKDEKAQYNDIAPILVICSYTPDLRSMSNNLSEFYDEYAKSNLPNPIAIEDINAQNLPDSKNWRPRLEKIISKYCYGNKRPKCIILLGNEASTTYFSIDDKRLKTIPIIIGVRGSSIVKLPKDNNADTKTWEPEALDVTKDFKNYNIVGGRVYEYDIKKNYDLIKHFYPKCDTLTLITDNTLGGVNMKAMFKEYAKTDKRFMVKYLDGRNISFMEADEYISELPPTQALMIGTWRVDDSNRYLVRNTTYTFSQNNLQLPVFSLSDVAIGHWPIGGYSPRYHTMGKFLAEDVVAFIKTGKKKSITIAANKYIFDYDRIKVLGLSLNGINYKYELVNKPISVFEQYHNTIITVTILFVVLTFALIVSLSLLKRSKILRAELVVQSEKLLIAKENAETANKMKSRFIANMSHEIRTPLNAVLGFAQILTSDMIELTPEEKAEYGNLIMTNGDLLLKLVNDVLDISKIDAGKMEFNMETIDAVELIHTAAMSATANKKDTVEIYAESDIDSIMIDTDKNRLLQVISNLLNNAKKCTESGSIVVSLKKLDEEDMISISVTDTGCGIPKEKAETVFERFKKLDSFRQGTGLGLSICRAIINQLGGKIWVDTSYTGGARFTFTHPIHPLINKEN